MKYEIETADNGYILRTLMSQESEDERDSVEIFENFGDLLSALISYEEPGGRYDSDRLYVIRAPGDKNSKWSEEHERIIRGNDIEVME